MAADIAIVNGKLLSMDLDLKRTQGTAVAIKDGMILEVGTDEQIMSLAGPGTEIINAGGNTILPGLCDAHCHASFTASSVIACDLFNIFPTPEQSRADIIQEIQNRLRIYITNNPDYEIIRGTGWSLGVFNGKGWSLPTRQDLDEVCRDKPVVLESFCQHNLWVNTEALRQAGIDANTKDPDAGTIVRAPDGNPNGVFHEMAAMDLIRNGIPGYDYTVEQYKETLRYYQRELANRYGVTLINDVMYTDNAREAYRQLAAAGELTLRVRGAYCLDSKGYKEQFQEAIARRRLDETGDLFRIHTIKVFLEGEFCMCEPFEANILAELGLPADYTGKLLWTEEQCRELFIAAMDAGFQIHIHAMGDASTKLAINSLSWANDRAKSGDRHVVAHLMALQPEDLALGGKIGLVGACQPRWMVPDTDIQTFCVPYFSKERAYDFYPNKRLRDAGWIVSYGTDFPVTPPPDPFHEIQCGMTRALFPEAADYEPYKDLILGPEKNPLRDAVSLEESIQSLTILGAYQNYLEHTTGSIEPGKSAEVVILDRDLEDTPTNEIYKTRVRTTLFKGNIVYQGE